MRGLNRVLFAGHATDRIIFAKTGQGAPVCTFVLVSERSSTRGAVSATAKVNVYVESLVEACRGKLEKGCYVLVEGELMNRDSPSGRATEVRAWELSFFDPPKSLRGGTLDESSPRSDPDSDP